MSQSQTWIRTSLIESGTFSHVFKATKVNSNIPVAMKILSYGKHTDKESALKHFNTEIDAYKRLKHPNILLMLDNYTDNNGSPVVIFEFCPLCLHDMIVTTPLQEYQIKKYFRHIGEALKYLSTMNVVHGDIKNENILINFDDEAKLCDMGFCKRQEELKNLNVAHGTITHLSPEIFESKSYSPASDVWAYGISMYQAMYRRIPFGDIDEIGIDEFGERVIFGAFLFPEASYSMALKGIVTMTLNINPATRAKMEDILNDEFFKESPQPWTPVKCSLKKRKVNGASSMN